MTAPVRYVGLGFAFLTAAFQLLALTAGALTDSGWGLFLLTVPLAPASFYLSRKGRSRLGVRTSKVTLGVVGVFFGLPFAALCLMWVGAGVYFVFHSFWT